MTDSPNAELTSPKGKSGNAESDPASSQKAEPTSVPEEFTSQGKLDPEEATSFDSGEVTKPETGKTEKSEKPESTKKPEEKSEKSEKNPLTDEERDEKLFGKEGKGESDLSSAQEKLFTRFEKAFETNDKDALTEIDKTVESKPKLVTKVSENLFDLWSDNIKEGDKKFLQKLSSLSDVAPKIANAVASKFWQGEEDDKKFFKTTKDLFEFIEFEPKEKKETKKTGKETSQKETILELNLKLSDVAHEIGNSFDEFKKTAVYDKFIAEASKFTRKGMEVSEFWDTVKKAVLSDTNIEKAKKTGAAEEKLLNDAGFSSPSGRGDDKTKKAESGFSKADNDFLDTLGVNKTKVAERIVKNKKGK